MNLVKISEAASLALHAATVLAREPETRRSVAELAVSLHASEHHLAKVMQRMERAGLVLGTRGPKGGFVLARPLDRITLLEIFESVEGPIGAPGCLLHAPACDGTGCVMGGLVQAIHTQVRDYFVATTLATLVGKITLLPNLPAIGPRSVMTKSPTERSMK